jgi:hypothetical protein
MSHFGGGQVADEDTFVMTSGLARNRSPRRSTVRGTVRGAVLTPSRSAPADAAALLADSGNQVRRMLAHSGTDTGLAAAGTDHLAGRVSPVGAAATAFAAVRTVRSDDRDQYTAFADAWLVEHGPVFAAEAAVAQLSMTTDRAWASYHPGDDPLKWLVPGSSIRGGRRGARQAARGKRLRRTRRDDLSRARAGRLGHRGLRGRRDHHRCGGVRVGPDIRGAGRVTPSGWLLGLERRGWQREGPQDAGWQGSMQLRLPDGTTAARSMDPGIINGDPTFAAEQRIDSVTVRRVGHAIDPIVVSEILRDLEQVTG